jgi:hypothetical protein
MFRITEDPSSNIKIKIIKYLKVLQHVSDHRGSIIQHKNLNYKIFKSAPTCFESQRIHHQGNLYSAWLKTTIFSQALYKAPC